MMAPKKGAPFLQWGQQPQRWRHAGPMAPIGNDYKKTS